MSDSGILIVVTPHLIRATTIPSINLEATTIIAQYTRSKTVMMMISWSVYNNSELLKNNNQSSQYK